MPNKNFCDDAGVAKPLPHNLEAERAILGAVLLDNDVLKTAIEKVKPEDFFLDPHRRIFGRMISMGETQTGIDLTTLTEALDRSGELECSGGHSYLAALMDGMPRISNVAHYARIVKGKAVLRNLIHAADAIQQQAFTAGENEEDVVVDRARAVIDLLAETRVNEPRVSSEEAWPEPMAPEAFYGMPGDFVRRVEPETEADPQGLLANFLVASGALFNREAYCVADGKRHCANEFLLTVGNTGEGRKGTATNRVLPVVYEAEPGFNERVLSGLSSGEGLVKGISPEEEALALETRRYLIVLPEFATLLGVMRREGNTMSGILREAYDGNRLRVMTRHDPLCVDNVQLSCIAHVTPRELLNGLTETDRVNGFANRFLVICVRRSKFLPEGGDDVDLRDLVARLRECVDCARGRGRLYRDDAARELWAAEYPNLSGKRVGLRGALLSRAETHVLRLSLLYALLDCADAIREPHLRAALAFWRYVIASVTCVFGVATGDPVKDKILTALATEPKTRAEMQGVFGRNRPAEWVALKMQELVRDGSIVETTKDGERKERVFAWGLNHS